MHYSIHIMHPVAQRNTEVRVVDLGKVVDHERLDALLRPLLDGDDYEHVTVLWRGRRADMFIGENSTDALPVNAAATSIYRAATLAREPGTDPECLPRIHGTAVLFEEIIWR